MLACSLDFCYDSAHFQWSINPEMDTALCPFSCHLFRSHGRTQPELRKSLSKWAVLPTMELNQIIFGRESGGGTWKCVLCNVSFTNSIFIIFILFVPFHSIFDGYPSNGWLFVFHFLPFLFIICPLTCNLLIESVECH